MIERQLKLTKFQLKLYGISVMSSTVFFKISAFVVLFSSVYCSAMVKIEIFIKWGLRCDAGFIFVSQNQTLVLNLQ